MGILDSIAAFFSAHFLSAGLFGLLGLVPLVVLLYLLKLRRTEIVIPSTMLWMKNLEDLTANAPFQRLRKNLLLLLQLIVLIAVITALARPFVVLEGTKGRNLCLIIDSSASMQTIEDGKTRLELAKEAALELLDGMGDSDRAMVVSFGEKTDVLCEPTDDRRKLRSAIRGIKSSDTRTNVREVMMIARSLAPDNRDLPSAMTDLKLVLLSDGKISDLEELGSQALSMEYVRIGQSSFNAGIVAFSLRTPEEGQDQRQAFVLVHNESQTPLSTTVTISLDDRVIGSCEISAPPASDGQAVLDLPHIDRGILKAELDHKDALALDNVAWLVVRPRAKIKALLVTKNESAVGYFLKRALALDPRVDPAVMDPKNYVDTIRYDLTIFDNWSPEKLPTGCLAFFNAVPPVPGLSSEGTIKNPPVLALDSDHFLMRFLNPSAVRIQEAIKLKLPEGARTLLSTTDGPLIADVSQGDQRIAVVAFDMTMSNWPLNLSFPLFVQNMLAWTPALSLSRENSIPTGRPLTIIPDPEIDHATVILPDGTARGVEMTAMRPAYFAGTEFAGVYRVQRGNEVIDYAVNLLDRNETSITPAPSLKVGRGEVVAHAGKLRQNLEFWRWLLLLGIIVLAVEWWVYSRRALI